MGLSVNGKLNMPKVPKFPWKIGLGIAMLVVTLITTSMMIGVNDAGHRTVIQYPDGGINIKFTPGWYLTWFGRETVYNDVITFDFDKEDNAEQVTLDQKGVAVRYQRGGRGTIYGLGRFNLPSLEDDMLRVHKAFRSNDGVAHKLIKTVSEEAMNLSAGLMSSEEAYAEKRTEYTQLVRDQLENGKFKTKLTHKNVKDEATGKMVYRKVPEIVDGEDGKPVQFGSDLKTYGVQVSGFQITDWDFEEKTLQQISEKREANMAIITAKANAEKSLQDAITREAKGKANVMKAKYEKEEEKIRAVVDAEKAKEVAIIKAVQRVDVAEQIKLEAEQKKLAAIQIKEEQILLGEGEGERKRLVMEADGALAQKLETYERVQGRFASAIEKQKWVPEVQMGSNSGSKGTGTAASDLIEMLNVRTAKDLALDMKMTGK